DEAARDRLVDEAVERSVDGAECALPHGVHALVLAHHHYRRRHLGCVAPHDLDLEPPARPRRTHALLHELLPRLRGLAGGTPLAHRRAQHGLLGQALLLGRDVVVARPAGDLLRRGAGGVLPHHPVPAAPPPPPPP